MFSVVRIRDRLIDNPYIHWDRVHCAPFIKRVRKGENQNNDDQRHKGVTYNNQRSSFYHRTYFLSLLFYREAFSRLRTPSLRLRKHFNVSDYSPKAKQLSNAEIFNERIEYKF